MELQLDVAEVELWAGRPRDKYLGTDRLCWPGCGTRGGRSPLTDQAVVEDKASGWSGRMFGRMFTRLPRGMCRDETRLDMT